MATKIISPVDGSVVAERHPIADRDLAAAVADAVAAQRVWRSTPIDGALPSAPRPWRR